MSAIQDRSEDYQSKREELIEKVGEKRQEDEQAHQALLNAVSEGEEFEVENYEWVQLGNVDVKVKTWFPGDVIDKISSFSAEEINPSEAQSAIHSTVDALGQMTEMVESGDVRVNNESGIRSFYKQYYDKWGDQGLEMAVKTILEPAQDNSDKSDVMDSFRSEKDSERVRRAHKRRS